MLHSGLPWGGVGGLSLCPGKGVSSPADPWHNSVGSEPAATLARDRAT